MPGQECYSKLRVGFYGVGIVNIVVLLMVWLGHVGHKAQSPRNPEPLNAPPVLNPVSVREVFVVTGSYGGQMTRAIRNMLVQQCWAGIHQDVNMSIVEPFSTKSQLVHTPQIWKKLNMGQLHTVARFSDYYNVTHYNLQSLKHNLAPLISWNEFIRKVPQNAIAVRIPTHGCSGVKIDSECSHSKSFRVFKDEMSKLGVSIVKNVCLTCSTIGHSYTTDDFINILFQNVNATRVSVMYDSWRNFGFTSSWIRIPDYCKLVENPESSSFLRPSYLIGKHSQTYINTFVKRKQYVGIMLRIERFLTLANSGRSNESIGSCLNKTLSMYDNIKSLRDVGVYVTVDIGKYGSGVMQREETVSRFGKGSLEAITQSVESVFRHLYNQNFTLDDWEATFVTAAGGVTERGYIAMLQRDIACHSDCLILMGGGSFQQVAGFHYLENIKRRKRSPCLYTVCTSDSFSKLFL